MGGIARPSVELPVHPLLGSLSKILAKTKQVVELVAAQCFNMTVRATTVHDVKVSTQRMSKCGEGCRI